MSQSDTFLADVVVAARDFSEGATLAEWRGSCFEIQYGDSLRPRGSSPLPATANITQTSSAQLSSNLDIPLQLSLLQQSKQETQVPEPTFGAVLAEIYLVLSVLSKQDGPARVDPISTLQHYPILGYGKSFVARLVPSSRFKSLKTRPGEHVVFKSLRHREVMDSRHQLVDDRTPRLQSFLRELRVLTHNPLRAHENIIHLVGVGWERNRFSIDTPVFYWPFLVLEHAKYGSLIDLLEDNLVDFGMRRLLCLDVGLGLSALHECDVIHGDVKPENVLVSHHHRRRYIAKIADFGFTLLDLEGDSPSTQRLGYTAPWEAPESANNLTFADRILTDVYSYGFLIWRTVSYGHYPFDQGNGTVSAETLATIGRLKGTDGIPEFSSNLINRFLKHSLAKAIVSGLKRTIRRSSADRNLKESLRCLSLEESVRTFSATPIRSGDIPDEQGLGIYSYGSRDMRLNSQFLKALESHYLHAKCLGENMSFAAHLLIHHGCATLAGEYLERHFAGDIDSVTYPAPNLTISFLNMLISAGAQSTASAEAIVPTARAFKCEAMIPSNKPLAAITGYALHKGSEFVLRDVMLSDVIGKREFLDSFGTKWCRGAGMRLSIPKEVFDGTGARYGEFLSQPFWIGTSPGEDPPDGIVDSDYLLRIAAGWNRIKDVKLLIEEFGANVNAQDIHGETALLKACRAGHVELVEWLIKDGRAMASIGSHKNVTPLHWLDSFPKEKAGDMAVLLHSAQGDPNAIMTEEFGGSEGNYWFFKGPPLMRVVAAGNLAAVQALLELGADPLSYRLASAENPLVFAIRRAHVDIVKAFAPVVSRDLLWSRNPDGIRPIYHVLSASPAYLAKIHQDRLENALLGTFNYLWSLADPKKRQFLTIDGRGRIAIQVAIANGNFPLVKRIADTCPNQGHLKELVVTLGMQTAILEGRYAMFRFLLDNGGLALHPALKSEPAKDSQFEAYVTCGPWTQDLAEHQRKTNSLHLCAQAGEHAQRMCEALLRSILPASRWDVTPETLRQQNVVDCTCNSPLEIDPIVDCRNELDETPFFCALEAEEYEMAHELYQAGASQNVNILHKAVLLTHSPHAAAAGVGELPLAEHALRWTSAYRALHFIIHNCWGCLRLTSQHGDELSTCVIEETTTWPLDEALEMFEYIKERAYPTHRWDDEILQAIRMRNQAVVASILWKREELIPTHTRPLALYDAVRESLSAAFKRTGTHRAEATRRLTKILELIKKHYPDYPLGGLGNSAFVETALHIFTPEIYQRSARYTEGHVSLLKLEEELNRQLFPWLVSMLCGTGPFRTQSLQVFEVRMQGMLGPTISAKIDLNSCRIKLVSASDISNQSTGSASNTTASVYAQELNNNVVTRSVRKRTSLSFLSTVFRTRK